MFLCAQIDDLQDTKDDTWVTVTCGLPTIIKASIQCEDGLDQQLSQMDSVDVHVRCRRFYTESTRISSAIKRKALSIANDIEAQSSSPTLRGADSTCDIKRDCMFCAVNQDTLMSTLHGQMDERNRLVIAEFTNWKDELSRRAFRKKR